jgi:coatomer protein complex subunit epsilon
VRDLVLEVEGGEGAAEEGGEVQEGIVRVMAGSVFYLEKEVEEAVATLTEGSAKSDLEW